jgi:uncharacterized membrane protein
MPDRALPLGHEHTLRRLEAFSDIVIAFALSELAFSLQVPASASALLAHPGHYAAFAASFGVICSSWWLHNRLFAYLFVADAIGILLNFILLAAIVMVGFALQLFFRFENEPIVAATYACSLALMYGLIAVLYAKGLRDERLTVDPEIRREATRRARRLGIVAVILFLSLFAYRWGSQTMELTWLALIPAVGALRIVERTRTP